MIISEQEAIRLIQQAYAEEFKRQHQSQILKSIGVFNLKRFSGTSDDAVLKNKKKPPQNNL